MTMRCNKKIGKMALGMVMSREKLTTIQTRLSVDPSM